MLGRVVLKLSCPSCGRTFRGIEPMQVATTVHQRTCRNAQCREVWNVTVRPLVVRGDGRIDRCDLTFIRHSPTPEGAK